MLAVWAAYNQRRRVIRLAATIGYQLDAEPLRAAPQPLVAWGLELDRVAADEARRRAG